MGRARDDGGRPVEPGQARATGNDPDAVEVHRSGGSSGGSGYGDGHSRSRNLGPDIPADGGGRYGETEVRTSRSDSGVHRAGYDGQGGQGAGEQLASERRDSIRWGPIWAGLITTLTTFLLLQLLAIGVGLVGGSGGGGVVSAIIGLIAFFTGGAVAGMTSAIRGPGSGLLNGFMVWALGTVLILLLSVLGLGTLFGALGNVAGQLNPGAISGAAGAAQQNAPNVSAQQAGQALQTGAIGAFFGLLVSSVASMLGGLLGGRSRDPIGRPTDAARD